jgi:hypothetical protein
MRFRHPRRAAIAKSSPASVAIPIATPSEVGHRPPTSWLISHPASSFIGARFRADRSALSPKSPEDDRVRPSREDRGSRFGTGGRWACTQTSQQAVAEAIPSRAACNLSAATIFACVAVLWTGCDPQRVFGSNEAFVINRREPDILRNVSVSNRHERRCATASSCSGQLTPPQPAEPHRAPRRGGTPPRPRVPPAARPAPSEKMQWSEPLERVRSGLHRRRKRV